MSEKMSIEEYKEKMEELFDECEKVLAQFKGDTLAELKESKKEGKWKPELHDKFWFRDTYGDTTATVHNHITNMNIFENTKVFPTKEECERYWHFMDTVKEKSYEFSKEEWKNDELFKFWIDRDCTTDTFHVARAFVGKGIGTVYFKSPEDAQYIIDNFKAELMEYWI